MLTFTQIITEIQDQTQDTDATSLRVIKRAVNQGMRKFGAILNRDWRDDERTFSVVANQQYYQMPEDAIRVKAITVTIGNIAYPLTEIADQDQWNRLNMRVVNASYPRYYYVKGSDQFGIWPIPSGSVSNAGTLTFEKNMKDMTADDVSSPGTVTVTNGSAVVLGSGTSFTANMVGRVFFADPNGGTGDGGGYKIASFTDTTHITLENAYAGVTGGSKAYNIGEVPDIPDEFHEALIDYGGYRYYRRRRDLPTAKDLKAAFDEAVVICQENYSSKTSSQYSRSPRTQYGYVQYSNQNRMVT